MYGAGMRVAERVQEPGATLLLGEFFEVYVKEDGRQAETQIYQAMEFRDTEEGVTVKGMYYATARIVLGYRGLPGGRHTYDDEQSSSDADVLLRDGATELVRVTNCTAWYNMGALTDGKPRVVHPDDIKERGVSIAGKAQHYVCGSQAHENHRPVGIGGAGGNRRESNGFVISPLPRAELVSRPENLVGPHWLSVTACWDTMDDMFARARAVLRDGSGMRSGAFDMQWSMGEFRFWNQVSDTAEGDWAHSTVTRMDRRFDASFNFQQLSRDVRRAEITYKSKQDFKRLQMVSGIFGLVGVAREAQQGASIVSRFRTGTNLRVCTSDVCLKAAPEKGPGAVLEEGYWKARAGTHGTFRMRYDKEEGKRYGTLTVRIVWHELTYKDVEGFEDKYLIVG